MSATQAGSTTSGFEIEPVTMDDAFTDPGMSCRAPVGAAGCSWRTVSVTKAQKPIACQDIIPDTNPSVSSATARPSAFGSRLARCLCRSRRISVLRGKSGRKNGGAAGAGISVPLAVSSQNSALFRGRILHPQKNHTFQCADRVPARKAGPERSLPRGGVVDS